MQRKIREVLTLLFMNCRTFNRDDWEYNPLTCYFEHKVETLKVERQDGSAKVYPWTISAKRVRELAYRK